MTTILDFLNVFIYFFVANAERVEVLKEYIHNKFDACITKGMISKKYQPDRLC